jgi:HEAT repeat protein
MCNNGMFFKVFFCCLCAFSLAWACEVSEENAIRRVHGHLLIKDLSSAVKEARQFILQYPTSVKLHMTCLEALCQKGEEVEAFQQLSTLRSMQQENLDLRVVSEWLAWGVLSKGEESPLLMTRLYSLLGAGFTQDARAIPILLKEMRGSNAFLRSLAIRLSVNYGDAPLKEELLRLLKEEKMWFVRLEVMKAVGVLKIKKAKDLLQKVVAHPRTLAEEKVAAIIALVHLYDAVSSEELHQLLGSPRAGLRHLGSEMMAHFDCRKEAVLLLPLLQDDCPDVRISAMTTLGLLQVTSLQGKPLIEYLQDNLTHLVPEVAITAGWLATVLGFEEGPLFLKKWLEQDRLPYRRLAAAAIAICGAKGSTICLEKIALEKDPYTRVNLAIGLISQRKKVSLASEVLFEALSEKDRDLWMWSEGPLFQGLSPSDVRHMEMIPRYPQVVDQLTQLKILSYLALVKHPKALDAVKDFLRRQEWGVTGAAALTLLQEGDESSLQLVQALLTDPDEKVRVQAALMLALFGKDPAAVQVLMQSYAGAHKELKIHILEALGAVGDLSSVPFLLDLLKEPFQMTRVVAASALIQCIYH